MIGLPTDRPPTHPGEVLLEEFVKPLGMTQKDLAERLGVSYVRVSEIVHGRRGITPDTALRLARLFNTSPELWLGLQQDWELWHAAHSEAAREIEKITPVRELAHV